MKDKGYPHPIYSLDLQRAPSRQEEDDVFFVPLAGGDRLVTSLGLRQQGKNVSTSACVRATRAALAHFPYAHQAFTRHGLDQDWHANMHHWIAQAQDLEARGHLVRGHALIDRLPRQDLPERAQRLWTRLRLASHLAGLGDQVIPGRMPRRRNDIKEALHGVLQALDEPFNRESLALCGVGDDDRDALRELIAAFDAAASEERDAALRLRRTQGALYVVRGALLGDIAHFCRVARYVFPPEARRELRLQRLLG
jgi:hypothetical protein